MSITTKYDFNNSSNFTFDSSKIEFVGSLARLKLQNLSADFTQDFASSSGFTFNAAKTEFVGGVMRQKDQRPSDATFGATFTNDINGNWGNGTLTGTAYGGATVSGGKLDLTGSTKYVGYSAVGNADSQQVGCIQFKYTPNYSGSPAATRMLFAIHRQNGSLNNLIMLSHNSARNLALSIYSATGTVIMTANLGTWLQTAAQEYIFSLNYDLTSGATRLFIDGAQFGTTQTGTGTRDANILLVKIGADYNGSNMGDGFFDDLVIFQTVQHTSNYTASYTLPETIYGSDVVTVPEMEYTGAGTLQQLTSITTTEGNAPRYTLQVGRSGNYLYWNGSAWVTSNNTYAQANTKADFIAHCSSLTIAGNIYGQFRIYFTDSNSSQQTIDILTASVVGQQYDLTNPTIKTLASLDMDALRSFASTFANAGSDAVKFVLEVDGVNKYWSGTAWITSTGYAQSNTATEINANCDDLDIDLGATIRIVTYLHSATGMTTPTITDVTAVYNFFAQPVDTLNTCAVWGYIYDDNGSPLSGISVSAQLIKVGKYKTITQIGDKSVTTTSDVNGYWELDLVECENIVPTDDKYEFVFSGTGYNKTVYKAVPNQVSCNFFSLT